LISLFFFDILIDIKEVFRLQYPFFMKQKHKKIYIHIPADLSYSQSVRSFGKSLMETTEMEESWVARLVLVIDELFSNAVKYGSLNSDEYIDIIFSIYEKKIEISVSDMGKHPPIDPKKLEQKIHKRVEYTDTNGRGLAIIAKEWTDSLSISNNESGGIHVSFQKAFS
jgi:anti-sigma regulatory factor (Ser/Thr protein kinase)